MMRLLSSLAPQFDPLRHELIIAENGTPTPSQFDAAGIPITHLHDSRAGKCRVQNRAIAQARGRIIACLDDDLVAGADYLAEVQRFFEHYPQYAAMKGRILPAEDPAIKAGTMAPYLDLPIVDHGEDVVEVRGVMGANMAFRAAALRQVGPFDERLGPGAAGHEEETEMSQRMRRAGFRIGYAPRAVVFHEVDPSRAVRERFLRVARERGFCRILHESHSRAEVELAVAVATVRVAIARALASPIIRLAREERRLAVAQGMRDGLFKQAANAAARVNDDR